MTASTTATATTTAIRHRLGVEADPAAVYGRLATVEGLRRWWTQDVRGNSAVGEEVSFHFGAPERYAVMEVRELTPDERVVWRCVDGPEEWIDTEFTFEIRPADPAVDATRQDAETVVLFTNDGWREPVEFMHHCSTKWASYLIGLKQDVETGDGRPFPHDLRLSGWD